MQFYTFYLHELQAGTDFAPVKDLRRPAIAFRFSLGWRGELSFCFLLLGNFPFH